MLFHTGIHATQGERCSLMKTVTKRKIIPNSGGVKIFDENLQIKSRAVPSPHPSLFLTCDFRGIGFGMLGKHLAGHPGEELRNRTYLTAGY